MRKQQAAIIALGAWLILIAISMVLVQIIEIEVFFVFVFIGMLVITKFMEPKYIQPHYLRYFWILIVIGIVIFCLIAVQKTLQNI
jgi:hypothetical protein